MRFFEELEIGARRELGSFTFTAEAIKKFAAQFDPQAFTLTKRRDAGRCSAVWRHQVGMSGRSA